jgi:beta-lactamase regulating signal transducer with metallopeptidase domain
MLLIAYSLLMSLLHSLWQAGAILLLYWAIKKTILEQGTPTGRRNLLVLATAIQIILSSITFLFYYLQPANNPLFLQKWGQFIAPNSLLHTVAPWLMAAYITVLGIKITTLFLSWQQFKKMYKMGLQKPSVDLKVFATVTAHQLGIKKKVQLWLSNTINTPVTFGFLKPIILLPAALVNQLSLQQAEALIVHELTHIKVNDYLLNWFLSAAEGIFFFNPFVLQLCSHAKLEREKNCDINVLHFGSNALLYAETLLVAAKMQREKLHWQLAAVGIKKQLLQRIHFFTADNIYTHNKKRFTLAAVPLLAIAFISFLCVLSVLPVQQKRNTAATGPFFKAGASSIENQVFALPAAPLPPVKERSVAKTASRKTKVKTIVNKPIVIEEMPLEISDMDALPENIQSVAFNNGALEKEVIIEEQGSGNRLSSIAVYALKYKNGQWVLTPKWKATSRKMLVDTGLLKKDLLILQPAGEQ